MDSTSLPSDSHSCIVSLDIGSSSVRALLFDAQARQVAGYGAQLAYEVATTPAGGAEVDPDKLAGLTIACLDQLHQQVYSAGLRIAAVGGSAFWHKRRSYPGGGSGCVSPQSMLKYQPGASIMLAP